MEPNVLGVNAPFPSFVPPLVHVTSDHTSTKTTTLGTPPTGHTRVVIVGCTHGAHNDVYWPPGDILIHTGDVQSPHAYSLPYTSAVEKVKTEWLEFTRFMMNVKKRCGYKWVGVLGTNF